MLPTLIPIVREGALDLEEPGRESRLAPWARYLDRVLGEAVQDLGLTLDVSERSRITDDIDDEALVERAAERWVISPRLERAGGQLKLRLLAVAPGSRVLMVRTQTFDPRDLEVRSMVMLRDLVEAGSGVPQRPGRMELPEQDERAVVYHARSAGRAVLALNAAALGGYVGFSLQRASGSSDARLTYPLVALGTGLGLGASMIIADEWDVGLGDAWFLAAGAWWPLASGWLLAESYGVTPDDEKYAYGLLGATAGVALATTALTFKGMSEGGALLTHSGGALGALMGAITQLTYEGDTEANTRRGIGYGAGAGVLAAGLLATQIEVSPSRVLLVDLGASLGALTGAAVASPLLFVDTGETLGATRQRAWLLSVAAGTLAGGAVALFMTSDDDAGLFGGAQPYVDWGPELVADRDVFTFSAGVRGSL